MTHALPGHHAPAAGFEVPLEMLAACHDRVQQQCDTLERLLDHLRLHGADRSAREAATAVLRYFDTAARHHHDDEEQDLFPALLEAMAGSDAVCLREMTAALTAEHRTLERHWARLRMPLSAIAEARSVGAAGAVGSLGAVDAIAAVGAIGPAAALDAADVPGFVALYAAHIAREEAELLPMAARLLADAALDRIGLAMRQRRGVGPASGPRDPLRAPTSPPAGT